MAKNREIFEKMRQICDFSIQQELLHYVFIMRCFPATHRYKIDDFASKLDFLMNLHSKSNFLADEMLVAMVTKIVAMVTKVVPMVTKVVV